MLERIKRLVNDPVQLHFLDVGILGLVVFAGIVRVGWVVAAAWIR